jgi:hypothetical protein
MPKLLIPILCLLADLSLAIQSKVKQDLTIKDKIRYMIQSQLEGDGEAGNERPIIGILSHDMISKIEDNGGEGWPTQIPDRYVKFVELAGARVIPLIYQYHNEADIAEIMPQINGVLFPGGEGDSDYEDWEYKIY